jgi:hypothetical protein
MVHFDSAMVEANDQLTEEIQQILAGCTRGAAVSFMMPAEKERGAGLHNNCRCHVSGFVGTYDNGYRITPGSDMFLGVVSVALWSFSWWPSAVSQDVLPLSVA